MLLKQLALATGAAQFRTCAAAGDALSLALLPDAVRLLGETRQRLLRKHRLFLDEGSAALSEIQQINARLAVIHAEIADACPLTQAETGDFCTTLADHVLAIHDLEAQAIANLKAAMV